MPESSVASSNGQEAAAASDWVRVKDKKTGKYYFWNRVTNITTWRKPGSKSKSKSKSKSSKAAASTSSSQSQPSSQTQALNLANTDSVENEGSRSQHPVYAQPGQLDTQSSSKHEAGRGESYILDQSQHEVQLNPQSNSHPLNRGHPLPPSNPQGHPLHPQPGPRDVHLDPSSAQSHSHPRSLSDNRQLLQSSHSDHLLMDEPVPTISNSPSICSTTSYEASLKDTDMASASSPVNLAVGSMSSSLASQPASAGAARAPLSEAENSSLSRRQAPLRSEDDAAIQRSSPQKRRQIPSKFSRQTSNVPGQQPPMVGSYGSLSPSIRNSHLSPSALAPPSFGGAGLAPPMTRSLSPARFTRSEKNRGEDGANLSEALAGFQLSKQRKGLFSSLIRWGEKLSDEQIMCFQDGPLKKPILKMNKGIAEICKQTFKNILSYMEDRKSSKAPPLHAKKLLRGGLAGTEPLRDEMYLQLCKQITKHPNIYHCLRGWDLMLIFLAVFPPGPKLVRFLPEFIMEASKTRGNGDIQRRALLCSDRLKKIMNLGTRLFPPGLREIEAIARCEPVDVVVHLADDSSKLLQVDSYTLVKDFRRIVGVKCNLSCTETFNFFEVTSSGKSSVVDGDMRVLDVVSRWYARNDSSADRGEGDRDDREGVGDYKLVYRAEIVLDIDADIIKKDTMAVHLLYSQAVADMKGARYQYAATQDDATTLAAFQLQATYGDYRFSVHTQNWVLAMLRDVFPEGCSKRAKKLHIMPLCTGDKFRHAQQIIVKYAKLAGTTPHDAKASFVRHAQATPLYGSTWYNVQQTQFKEHPHSLYLAISARGVMLVNPTSLKLLEHFTYEQVVTWGHAQGRFILVVGNVVEQRKVHFRTKEGVGINHLLGDYVATMVAGAREIY